MLCRIPRLARLIADRYQDIFRDAGISYSMLCLFIAMTLCGIPSFAQLVLIASFSPSGSTLSRNAAKFNEDTMNRTQRRLASSVLARVLATPDEWIWVVDTTSNIKRTDGIKGGGNWANSKNEIFYGQNLMVLCAVNKNTGASIPILWRPCIKKLDQKEGDNNHDLLIEMIDCILSQNWPKLVICLDSWFDSAKLMEALSARKITFAVQLKSSRKPKLSPSPRHPKIKLVDIFSKMNRKSCRVTTRESIQIVNNSVKGIRYVAGAKIWIAGSGKNAKQIQLNVSAVYNHHNERNAFGYYATNDLSAPNIWSWKMSRFRWNIEVGFRDLRQGLNWGKFEAKNPNSANLSLMLPILIQGYLKENAPNQPLLGVLDAVRNVENIATLDYHAKCPNNSQARVIKLRFFEHFRKTVGLGTAEIAIYGNNHVLPFKKAA